MNTPFGRYLLITERRVVYIDPHELEYISVDLLVSVCQIVIYMLGDGEVEEDVKTAEGEVVEKAEEIDAEGNAGQ